MHGEHYTTHTLTTLISDGLALNNYIRPNFMYRIRLKKITQSRTPRSSCLARFRFSATAALRPGVGAERGQGGGAERGWRVAAYS
jgi:hypothetical protein